MPHTHTTIRAAFELIERSLARERREPVAPYATPDELASMIDFSLPPRGASDEQVIELLDRVAALTPRTGGPRFLNQLFGGRDEIAVAAELLTVALNTSQYTFKASGPHAVIERAVAERMARAVGYDDGEGVFAPGGSMSNFAAVVIARNEAAPRMKEDGHPGRAMTLYTSDQSHYSITKGAAMAGVGRSNVKRIATDDRGRMIPAALRRAIEDDLAAGALPFMINATAGTTVLGAFDPIEEIAPIAQEHGVWLHVDGALGGAMLLSDQHRDLLRGSELSDSFTWDAHKLMAVPLVCSAILVREKGTLARHFNEDASYLFQSDADELNFGTRSMQCGRRNDVLKLWAAWKRHGDQGLGRRVDHLVDLARHAAQVVCDDAEMILAKTPESVTVCFEIPGAPSPDVCEMLRRESRLLVGYAEVDGNDVIRIPMINPDLTVDELDEALAEIRDVGLRVRAARGDDREACPADAWRQRDPDGPCA